MSDSGDYRVETFVLVGNNAAGKTEIFEKLKEVTRDDPTENLRYEFVKESFRENPHLEEWCKSTGDDKKKLTRRVEECFFKSRLCDYRKSILHDEEDDDDDDDWQGHRAVVFDRSVFSTIPFITTTEGQFASEEEFRGFSAMVSETLRELQTPSLFIYVSTDCVECYNRIQGRLVERPFESGYTPDYISSLQDSHDRWFEGLKSRKCRIETLGKSVGELARDVKGKIDRAVFQ